MDVILLTNKVANLGNIGDRVKVKSGYGRNFLLPSGKATLATPANVAKFEARRAELEKSAAAKLDAARALAEKLQGKVVRVAQKAGVDGRLFGSVTHFDIAEGLTKMGLAVAKTQVRLPAGPLKSVGEYPVTVALHTDVVAEVTVQVVAQAD